MPRGVAHNRMQILLRSVVLLVHACIAPGLIDWAVMSLVHSNIHAKPSFLRLKFPFFAVDFDLSRP